MKITKTKKGYTTVLYLGMDEDQKSVTKRFTAETRDELKRMVTEYQYKFRMDVARQKSRGMTLYDAYGEYISSREHLLSPASVRSYKGLQKSSFPSLMNRNIFRITEEDAQKDVNQMATENSPKTIRDKVALLNSVLKAYRGITFDLYLPQRKKKELYIPTKEEVDKLLEFVRNTEWEVPILLASHCGLRRGEIAALTWDDIDFEHDTIHINKALGVTDDNSYKLKPPKSYAGYRDADMPQIVKIVLLRLSEEQKPLIAISINTMSNKFPSVLQRANLHTFRFHDLRHYFASRLLALGVPDLYVIRIIGHSTTSMLKEHYQHILSDEDKRYREMIKKKL